MVSTVLTLGLLGLACVSPVAALHEDGPDVPSRDESRGFHLVINVTDPTTDLKPPVINTYVTSIHDGAGLAFLSSTSGNQYARIFYQNATGEENEFLKGSVITDSGTPPFPAGITIHQDAGSSNLSTARVDYGPGVKGIDITRWPANFSLLNYGDWVACWEPVAYYHNKKFVVIKSLSGEDVPKGCTRVQLLPECTKLNDLPPHSYSNHTYVIPASCYANVSTIEWKKYTDQF